MTDSLTQDTVHTLSPTDVAQATITAPDEIDVTRHENTTLQFHAETLGQIKSDTAVYDITDTPTPVNTPTTDLINIEGIERITVTLQKYRTGKVINDITRVMRNETVTYLYTTNDEFKTEYDTATQNPVTRITNLVFNNTPDPETITYSDLPNTLQEQVIDALTDPSPKLTENTNVLTYKRALTDLGNNAGLWGINVKLIVTNPETNATTVKNTVQEHGFDVINEDHTLGSKRLTTLTDTANDLISKPANTHQLLEEKTDVLQ